MFIEPFVTDQYKRAELQKALAILNSIGFFQIMLELSYRRSGSVASQNILEVATMQRGFSLGYYQCIDDLFNFHQTFSEVVKDKTSNEVTADWGASKVLLDKGFTIEEIKNVATRTSR